MNRGNFYLNLTNYELVAFLKEVIKKGGKIELSYKTKNEDIIGFEIIESVESIYITDCGISCIFSNNAGDCNIIIPKSRKECITCSITHSQVERIDYDKLPDDEVEWILLNSPYVKDISDEYKYTEDSFTLHIDGFDIEVNIDNEIFDDILKNLDTLTTKYISHLCEQERINNEVDIDGYWESIDNMIEK